MNLFYAPATSGEIMTLDEEESMHCVRVLRLKKGDYIHITDGKGNLYEASIAEDHPKHCLVEVKSVTGEYQKRSFHLHIALAPTKNISRFEWFLEKATEIGIDEITPLFCQHSERVRMNTSRLGKVIIAAMKQSLKAYLPELHEPLDFSAFIQYSFDGEKYIAYCDQESTTSLKDIYHKDAKALILIGPEGDFSEEELTEARKRGFIPISLGKSRLRTETAGIVACHTITFLNQA